MMKGFKCFAVLLAVVSTSTICAQNPLSEADSRLTTLMQESDRGRFAFAYEDWLKEAKMVLSQASTESIVNSNLQNVRTLWIPDSTMQIFYLVKPWEGKTVELKWLVRFQFRNKTVICDFNDEFEVPVVKKMAADSAFLLSTEIYASGDDNIHSHMLFLKGVTTGNSYFHCIDLRTMVLFEMLLDRNLADDAKFELVQELDSRLFALWRNPLLFNTSWSCFKRMITLQSADTKMRICTYLVPTVGFDSYVAGAVLRRNDDKISVVPLIDRSDELKTPERARSSAEKWYGALYTDLVETRFKNKTFYTLLGFKSNDGLVKTRVIDAMSFQGDKISFGLPQFKQEAKTLYRHIFKYASGANMMLRYDDKLKMIVFDHLAPADPLLSGQYQYYGPDFSYDGYRFEKGNWFLQTDIDLRNPKTN